jgi:UDP-N-acetyl-L-fucosamine synthase
MKIATILGTRPEIIRLSRVMATLDRFADQVIIHTGQNYDYELNQIFFDDLEIRRPDHFLNAKGKNVAETIGLVISRVDDVLAETNPEAVLILGDTNSSLAAIAAKRRKIPVFHMEAGNRCFDERVPEEINRKIVDHISDINMPYSSIAREYLLREGLAPDRVIVTGSPMYEVLNHYMPKINTSQVMTRLDLSDRDFFLVSSHREENIDSSDQFEKLIGMLVGLVEKYGKRVIVSTHPRTRNKINDTHSFLPKQVELLKPLSFSEFVNLELHAIATLSDSGTITEEASILNFPALNIRSAHERPEGMEEGAVIMTNMNLGRVMEGLKILESQKRFDEHTLRIVRDYDCPNVSEKVIRVILSYTDYINRIVWRKN